MNEDTVRDFLAFSPNNPSSIATAIETARENARSVRTALTTEMWEAINGAWLELKRFDKTAMSPEEFGALPRLGEGRLARLRRLGLPHDAAQRRLLVHRGSALAIERADNTARILDVKYHLLLPETERVGGSLDYFQWTTILREVSALTAYHWVYRESVKPWLVADLLILNRQLPRSLANCYELLVAPSRSRRRCLWPPRTEPAPCQQHAGEARRRPHRRHLRGRAARVHQRVHRGEQQARDGHHRAISCVKPGRRRAALAAACNLRPMRVRIAHDTTYRYERPVRALVQALRLTPRDHDGQHVRSWRIEPSVDGRLQPREDALGNILHMFSADRAVEGITVRVTGEVETSDASGVLRGTVERVPGPVLSARDRSHRRRHGDLREFAADVAGDVAADPLAACTVSSTACTARRPSTPSRPMSRRPPRRGLRAAARRLPGPHPYLHRRRPPSRHSRPATCPATSSVPTASSSRMPGHAWAEAKVPHLGWVGFDPANGISRRGVACARRHRARLSRRGAGPRHAPGRRRGAPRRQAAGRGEPPQSSSGAGLSGAAGPCARPLLHHPLRAIGRRGKSR